MRQVALAAAGLGLAGLARLLAEVEAIVEFHRNALFPRIAFLLQAVSSGVSTTLGEAVAASLILGSIAWLVMRRGRNLGAIVFALGLLVAGFYLSWGLAYNYPPLSARLQPLRAETSKGDSEKRLVDLAERSARLAARASEGAVTFAGTELEFLARINGGLDAGFMRWPASIEASPIRTVSFGPAKASRVSFALSLLQISGYYFPWTGEAQIDAEMPRTLWPRVAAHEKAHQRGFAREDEATAIGVITCLSSTDPTVFYGGTLGLFVSLDRELSRLDPAARRRVWGELGPRVAGDLQNEAAFWKAHEGLAGRVSEKVNDTYLKAQGVRSGAGSYAEATRLILAAIETKGVALGPLLLAAEPVG